MTKNEEMYPVVFNQSGNISEKRDLEACFPPLFQKNVTLKPVFHRYFRKT